MVRAGDVIAGGTIAGGIAVLIFLGLKAMAKPPEGKYALTIEATEGGTTEPAPGTYAGDEPVIVTVMAIPSSGYDFDGWYLSGEKVSTELTYDVDVSGSVLLIASFTKIGAPTLIPSYVRPIQNATAEDRWRARITTELLTYTLRLEHSYYKSGYAKFKICDAAGNGVAGQKIAVYTEPNPDALEFGYVLLNDAERTSSNPLVLTSDAGGVVTAKVDYRWKEPNSDYSSTIGTGAKVQYKCPVLIGYLWYWVGPPIHHKFYINKPCEFAKGGIRIVRAPILRNINAVHAYWVDNPSLPVWGDASVDSMVKMESKLYGDVF